ncbi:MAG: aminotransferase class IV [Desulfobacterales bacterium]
MAKNESVIYLNGSFVAEDQAKISVFDRCFLYGDGIFEGISVYNGAPFKLDAHLKRMNKGLAYLCIENPLSSEEWTKAIIETIKHNDMDEGYLRPQVSRGEGLSSTKWKPEDLKKPTPNVVILPEKGLIYGEAMQAGLKAKVLSRPRIPSTCIPSSTKHCNYLDSVMGAIEVSASGKDVGIALDGNGFVTEGIAYNLFIVRDQALYTPPLVRDLLPGITRQTIIEISRGAGYTVNETDFDVFAMCSADEVFLSSSLRLGGPIVEIDGRRIGDGNPGPVTKKVGELLLAEMKNEAEAFLRQFNK